MESRLKKKKTTPLTCLIHSFMPWHSWTPTEFMKSAGVHRVTQVIVRSILNKLQVLANLLLTPDSLQLHSYTHYHNHYYESFTFCSTSHFV